ncbi:MAG: TonB family protein [Desulfobacteraceae bacterium]
MNSTTNYIDVISRRNWITWIWSGLAAVGLNLVLYLSMPHLMDTSPSRPSFEKLVPHVNVIRIKRPETPVRDKEVKPPDPPEPQKPRSAPQRPIQAKLTLPFEINPRLPGGPDTLALPPLESAPMPSADPSTVFSTGELDAPLTALVRIGPVYPMRARRRGIEGWVKVAFVVDEQGHVQDITILEAEPPGLFEQNARRCMAGWRFKPGTVEGMPVRTKAETTIRYILE